MTSSSRSPLSGLLLSLVASLLVMPLLGGAAQADETGPADPTAPGATAGPGDPAEVAEKTLEKVEGLIDGSTPPPVDHNPDDGHETHKDLTLELRDLAAVKDDLPRHRQADAERILARPDGSDGGCDGIACWSRQASDARKCGTRVCVHWVRESYDRASDAYAAKVLRVTNSVAERYKRAGYRAPKNDRGRGGSWKLDIYLADIGSMGYYGYCTSDRGVSRHAPYAAYCVLDNDYSAAEYGTSASSSDLLKVTAAHELFHAVQFAYDAYEDSWFMEATATWAEDEIYDSVDDNRYYLRYGPLARPDQPLNLAAGGSEYGAWIFFRHLTERFSYSQAGLPVIVRKMWTNAIGAGDDGYSLPAIEAALAERGTDLSTQLSSFAARNRQPARYYEEGAAYPVAAPAQINRITARAREKNLRFPVNQLAAKTLRYVPSGAMGKTWKLRIDVALDAGADSAAIITVKRKGRAPTMHRLRLDGAAAATTTRGFGSRVDWIEATVVNADQRQTDCYTINDPTFTCRGYPLEESVRQLVNVRAYH
ncbi:MXAN_6640 family putative metalloprotease [Nocardioides sp. SYSU DS0651]|uniref:MXAN_6640 family putative metalloprotease n=1 Tax=Nocardioides sp. SYSU DS0651 TaxID=3415955 RepID=UPI003F4B7B0F